MIDRCQRRASVGSGGRGGVRTEGKGEGVGRERGKGGGEGARGNRAITERAKVGHELFLGQLLLYYTPF